MQTATLQRLATDRLQPLSRLRAVPTALGVTAQIAQYRAGLDRGQLILVAQQHQPSMGRHGVEQIGHHFQVDHRRFIDHQHIQRQAVAGMVTEMPGARSTAEQTMHGGHIAGDRRAHRFGDLQRLHLLTDRLGQACSGLAGRCGQTNAQRMASLDGRCLQQREQAHHRSGFPRARAASDDAEGAARSESTGEFLPIDDNCGFRAAEQFIQTLRQIIRRRLLLHQALAQRCIDAAFVGPVAAQVQAFRGQHQRTCLRCFTRVSGQGHQWTACQHFAPMGSIERFEQLRGQQQHTALHIAFGRQ